VVRDEPLVDDVVLVDAPVGRARVEDDVALSRWQAPQVRHADLDDEPAARLEMVRDVAEAGDLGLLRREVHDRVVDEIGEAERAVDLGGREVADRHADGLPARLRPEASDHRL
jgi:hypothetical protein